MTAQVAATEQLAEILPKLIQDLSIGRAHLVIDQLKTAAAEDPSQIVMVTAGSPHQPDAAAVAVLSPSAKTGSGAAAIIHAASLRPLDQAEFVQISRRLGRALDQAICELGASFVQWGTEPETDAAANALPVTRWCRALGFESIAELEYLSGNTATEPLTRVATTLLLQPLRSDRESNEQFTRLVEQSFVDTRDCPRMAEFRTATQTVAGYRHSRAFEPALWFTAVNPESESEAAVGCLVMGHHRQPDQSTGVIELVYMGLLPAYRGRGLGRQILQLAINAADQFGGQRMIMAVDRSNEAAKHLYRTSGFAPVIRESVWVKSLAGAAG